MAKSIIYWLNHSRHKFSQEFRRERRLRDVSKKSARVWKFPKTSGQVRKFSKSSTARGRKFSKTSSARIVSQEKHPQSGPKNDVERKSQSDGQRWQKDSLWSKRKHATVLRGNINHNFGNQITLAKPIYYLLSD
jgi:hypothetical protein